MAKKRKYTTEGSGGSTLKTTYKPTKSGFKKKEVRTRADGKKTVRKVKTLPSGRTKVKTRYPKKK